ncbi:MAG: hypothetical protein K2J66_06075 [Muribaculaceae bacterium]|nr:hypothetical protein [Muribaculaceae bacterium]
MRKKLLSLAIGLPVMTAMAHPIDFDKIRHWTGTGPNKAALAIQFDTDGKPNPGVLVWGYRWEDGRSPNGVDMVSDIAENSDRLRILIQMTGDMGYTLDGVGYSDPSNELLASIYYDFDGAAEDSRISFGFYTPNTVMNQTSAPGAEALDLVMQAIDDAIDTHVIRHPLDYTVYGYPAYDYDWWKMDDESAGIWNSGWYEGYWSYWTGTEGDLDNLGYSGLGMSSVYLNDGDVHGWKYISFTSDEPDWLAPVYIGNIPTSVTEIIDDGSETVEYYSIDGIRLTTPPAVGIYIERRGARVSKRIANTNQ